MNKTKTPMKKREIKKQQWYVNCLKCGQEFTGFSINHCTANFNRHWNKHLKEEKDMLSKMSIKDIIEGKGGKKK